MLIGPFTLGPERNHMLLLMFNVFEQMGLADPSSKCNQIASFTHAKKTKQKEKLCITQQALLTVADQVS